MKKLLIIAFVLALFVPLAATAQQIPLNFLWYQDATAATYSTDVAFWAKFKADNPDIALNQEILFSNAYHDKLTAYIAAGTLPDVFFLWPSQKDSSALIHQQKLAKDLSKLLPADLLKAYNPAALDPNQQASKMLAELPQAFTYTSTMFTNVKMLKDLGLTVPTTYAQLKALVVKLKVKNIQTVLLPDGDGWPGESCLFSTIVDRLLGSDYQNQVLAGKAKFTDAGFINALKFWQTMYTDGVISWTGIQTPYGDGPGQFASGKGAFFVDGDWRLGAFLTDPSTKVALIPPAKQATDFGLYEFPAIPGEKFAHFNPGIAGTGLAISVQVPAGSDREKAAVRLLSYWYSKDVQTINYEVGNYIPSRMDVTSDKVEPMIGIMKDWKASLTKIGYVFDGVFPPAVVNVLNPGLQAIGLGAQTPAQVAADMQKAMDSYLATKK